MPCVYLVYRVPHVPSVLLWGPPGTGKRTLCRALAAAAGATWLTISPGTRWHKRFPGPKGAQLLVHTVSICAIRVLHIHAAKEYTKKRGQLGT